MSLWVLRVSLVAVEDPRRIRCKQKIPTAAPAQHTAPAEDAELTLVWRNEGRPVAGLNIFYSEADEQQALQSNSTTTITRLTVVRPSR